MNLDSLMVNFEVAMYAIYSELQEKQPDLEVLSANTNSASLGQISFAFPITSWLKSSFGLTPRTNMSYDVIREDTTDYANVGRRILNNYGYGGLNQVFLGIAAGTNVGKSQFSVGANMNYQFGTFTRNSQLIFSDTILMNPVPRTELKKYIEASGFFVELGFQYKQPISNQYQLGFGFTYTPKYKLDATQKSNILRTLPDYNNIMDSLYENDTKKGTLQIPDRYTFGLSFERLNRWVVGVEYSMINFENYREFGRKDPDLSNAFTFRAGMELIGRRLDNNFMNRLSYRFGYHYSTNYVDLNYQDSKLTQYGVSFGFGMPIRRSQSRMDFAVEIGRKGNMNNGQIQENYGRIVVGISAFERWFVRGKFD